MEDPFLERWPDLAADVRELADRYEEEDWTGLVLEPHSVDWLGGDRPGLRVVLGSDQYDAVDEAVGTGPFGTTHVLQADVAEYRQYVVAAEARTQELAVLVPAVLTHEAVAALEGAVAERETMHTHLEPPTGDRRVTISHGDPALFF